jgi:hypothetical protein
MEELKTVCKILVGIPERKRPLARPRRRWEYTGCLKKMYTLFKGTKD